MAARGALLLLGMAAPGGGVPVCPTCPKASDVIATSRSAHYAPDSHSARGYSTFSLLDAFEATQLDWVYTTNKSFVRQVHDHVRTITVAINPQCPDADGQGDSFKEGRVVNIHGQPLTAPWMRTWTTPGHPYGCINSPSYLRAAFDFAAKLVGIGADGLQHDDPTANGEAATWNGGDPELSGCCERSPAPPVSCPPTLSPSSPPHPPPLHRLRPNSFLPPPPPPLPRRCRACCCRLRALHARLHAAAAGGPQRLGPQPARGHQQQLQLPRPPPA
eukprot:COSAG04_NODE_3226_length_3027_cov_2.222678_2_plen_274_part_00